MTSQIKKIGVFTSGGDSPGMNAAIRAVVRTCAYLKIDCVGIYRGYQGMIEGDFKPMDARSVNNIINKGGTILKSARCTEFQTKEIPGTIDNDIFGTSNTLGFDTACNTVVEVIDKIRDTASSHNRLFFVEVMGRDVGHIALNVGVGAGAEEILIPEENLGLERLIESLKRSKASGKSSSIVVVAEGDQTGENVFELKKYVEKHLPIYDVRVSVLGHMQRGGAPSCYDRVLASRMGVKAVESLLEGKSSLMVGIQNNEITLTPISKAIKGHTKIDNELIRVSDIMTI